MANEQSQATDKKMGVIAGPGWGAPGGPCEEGSGQAQKVVDNLEREVVAWKMRALAAEEVARRQRDAVLMRGEFLRGAPEGPARVERRHGYALLEDRMTGSACLLDEEAVNWAALALGLKVSR